MTKRTHITGGAGFLESHLREKVNMGNPDEFTILELAKKVIDIIGSRSKIIHKPLPSDDPKQRKTDISLAKQELGCEPKIKLGDGLLKTIGYFEGFLEF